MSQTIEIPNNIPVSWLTRQERADNESLFLISVPNSRTETEYMSKFIKYSDLQSQLRETFDIGPLQQWINDLSASGILTSLQTNVLCCSTISNPYIISAIYQKAGNITALDGYRLSDGMDTIFQNAIFDYIRCENFYSSVISSSNLSVDIFNAKNVSISNLNVTHIHTTTDLVPSLYGYPMVEIEVEEDGMAYVYNKSVNFIQSSIDLRIDMVQVDPELSEISKDFEIFIYASDDCTVSFLFGETLLTPNPTDEDIYQLNLDNFYLFIVSQVNKDTFYINRQVLRNIDI